MWIINLLSTNFLLKVEKLIRKWYGKTSSELSTTGFGSNLNDLTILVSRPLVAQWATNQPAVLLWDPGQVSQARLTTSCVRWWTRVEPTDWTSTGSARNQKQLTNGLIHTSGDMVISLSPVKSIIFIGRDGNWSSLPHNWTATGVGLGRHQGTFVERWVLVHESFLITGWDQKINSENGWSAFERMIYVYATMNRKIIMDETILTMMDNHQPLWYEENLNGYT